MIAFSKKVVYNTAVVKIVYPGVAQLVGRLVWDQDAASSSLATRTKSPESACAESGLFCLYGTRLEQLNATVRWTVACCIYENHSLNEWFNEAYGGE